MKRIVNFQHYNFTSLDALRAAYAAAATCRYLIRGEPALDPSGDLVVEIRPVGFADTPNNEKVRIVGLRNCVWTSIAPMWN